MCRVIDQLAIERGFTSDDANYFFICISDHLFERIPALKQVMEDVFADAPDDKLQEHISKMIILLQLQGMKAFKTWQMPDPSIIRQPGSSEML